MAAENKAKRNASMQCLVNNWEVIGKVNNILRSRADFANFCISKFRIKHCDSKQKIMVELMLYALANAPKYSEDYEQLKQEFASNGGDISVI